MLNIILFSNDNNVYHQHLGIGIISVLESL